MEVGDGMSKCKNRKPVRNQLSSRKFMMEPQTEKAVEGGGEEGCSG